MREKYSLQPDLIFFTGDAAFGNIGSAHGETLKDQFAAAESLFEKIRETYDPPVPRDRFYLVPGNHDVDRKEVTQDQWEWLDRQSDVYGIYNIIRDAGRQWQNYMQRLRPYAQFLTDRGYTHLLGDPDRLIYSDRVQVGDLTIGIVGFNSAWSCCREYEQFKLWIAGRWQNETLQSAIKGVDLPIALLHHPSNWFVPFESKSFLRTIENDFRFCLHGHEHESWVYETYGHTRISAGACYERADEPTGYNFVRLDLDNGDGRVWLRKYDPRGDGWVPDPVSGKTDNEGCWKIRRASFISDLRLTAEGPALSHPAGGEDRLETVERDLQISLQSGQSAVAAKNLLPLAKDTVTADSISVEPQAISVLATGKQPPDGAIDDDELHRQITEAARFFEREQPDEAIVRLNEIAAKHRDSLSPRARFRIHANRGHAYLKKRELQRAASEYRQAHREQPTNVDAQVFDAIADDLLGDSDSAYTKGTKLLVEHPDSERAASLVMQTAPPGTLLADILKPIEPTLRASPRIAAAIAQRALLDRNYSEAVSKAREAMLALSDWTEAKVLFAAVVLQFVIKSGPPITPPVTIPSQRRLLEEAKLAQATALEQFANYVEPQHLAKLRLNLASIYRLLGDNVEAELEYRAGLRVLPDDDDLATEYALFLSQIGRVDEAIALLQKQRDRAESAKVALVLAKLLGTRRRDGDIADAVGRLKSAKDRTAELTADLRLDWLFLLIHLLLENGQIDEADAELGAITEPWLPPEARHVLRADIKQKIGDESAVLEEALAAYDAALHSRNANNVAHVAILLETLAEYEKALDLWRQLAEPIRVGIESRHLIQCAQRTRRFDVVLDFCSNLRINGIFDPDYIRAELAALERFSPQKTIEMLQSVMEQELDPVFRRELQAQLSYTGILAARKDLIAAPLALLPAVSELTSPRIGRSVVEVLRYNPDRLLGVEYAYQLFRRFPDDLDSYLAIMRSLGFPGENVELPEFDVVRAGAAVQYAEDDTRESFWIIVEESKSPKVSQDEYSTDNPLVAAMLGKKVGERFVLRSEPKPERFATVLQIQNKYVFRLRYCVAGLERRFPEQKVLWSMHTPKTATGEPDIKPLLEQIERHSDRVKNVQQWYRDNPVSLHMFSEQMGRSLHETMESLAATGAAPIRCCRGTSQEIANAHEHLSRSSHLVLDQVAICTLMLLARFKLDIDTILKALPIRCQVPEAAMDELRRYAESLRIDRERMAIGMEGSKFVRQMIEPEEANRFAAHIDLVLNTIASNADLIPGTKALSINLELGEQLQRLFGSDGVTALAAANDAGRVLWTDDFTLGEVARSEFKAARVWTQAVCSWLGEKELIPAKFQDEVTVRLAQMHYAYTSLRISAVILAAEKTNWDPDQSPFREIMERFGDPSTTPSGQLALSGALIHELSRRRLLVGVDERIILRLVTQLHQLPNGASIVRQLRDDIEAIVGLDIATSHRFGLMLGAGLAANARKILLP